jgi:zeta-carotene desaturase
VAAEDRTVNSVKSQPVLVLGGGLAGMAAAVKLSQAGVPVTLVETSRRLGGRASSHVDPASGQMIDNCQHVLMGCCTNLVDLYGRLGVAEQIAWHDELIFADKQGHVDVMRASGLPAPLHLSGAMLGFGTLSLADKVAIGRAMLAIMRTPVGRRDGALMDESFGEWLRRHGQTQRAIDRFWSVVVVSALNQVPDKAGAGYAMQVFQEGFLAHRQAYRMGVAAVPLRQLYDGAQRIIEAGGGSVLMGTSVERIEIEGDRVTGVKLDDGSVRTAGMYISALPFDRLEKALSSDGRMADHRFAGLGAFEHSPIVGIHLWFDRAMLEGPHLIFVDSPLQWVFEKGVGGESGGAGEAGRDGAGMNGAASYLHGVISAADAYVEEPAGRIVEMAVAELRQYPMIRRGELVRSKVVKEKRATFSPAPGLERHRPGTRGEVKNLMLAGDWTATGWPATMEGAVRSGYRAAAAAMGAREGEGLADDLPMSDLYRLVAGAG